MLCFKPAWKQCRASRLFICHLSLTVFYFLKTSGLDSCGVLLFPEIKGTRKEMWIPDSVKSIPTGFCRWARNDRWTRCLKGTPGDSLSDVKGTAGSIFSDLIFDRLLFWQGLQCTKCWIGRRIQLKGTGCQWQRKDGHPRSSGDEIWEVEIRKTSQKAGLYLICKCQNLHLDDSVSGMNEETDR